MPVAIRYLLLCAAVLALPALAAAQPPRLAVERVWTQDAGGNTKTAFAPGESIQFVARLNNSYRDALPAAKLSITTRFYNHSTIVDIPPGRSTWTWNATAPSQQNNTPVTVKAFNSFYRLLAVSSANIAITASQSNDSRYDPSHFGIPDTIGGYFVFAVLTEDNFPCMKSGEKLLVLQSPQSTIEDGPRDFPKEIIEHELKIRHLTDSAQWGWRIVGPGVTREQVVRQFEHSYRLSKDHACPTSPLPSPNASALAAPAQCPYVPPGSDATGGEAKCPPTPQLDDGPGFAIVQDLGPDIYPNNNAQSAILIAPDFRNGNEKWKCGEVCTGFPPICQPKLCGGYVSFLNNGMTDGGYFLQVGFYLTNRPDLGGNIPDNLKDPKSGCLNLIDPGPDRGNPFSPNGLGMIVWAAADTKSTTPDFSPRLLCVPYVPGHHYYTTITYTSGMWWTCAADMEDTTTYRCQPHQGAATPGTHLKTSIAGTNVFAEVWNKDAGRPWGLPPQLVAYGAKIYVDGKPYTWPRDLKFTQHDCQSNSWPPKDAIVESSGLVEDGYAYFNTYYLPAWCQ